RTVERRAETSSPPRATSAVRRPTLMSLQSRSRHDKSSGASPCDCDRAGTMVAMTLRNYLQGEVAADFADGLLTRREALHRLGLMGLGATAAGTLLASCSKSD